MEQCSTVVEAVTSVVEETAFETQCAMVSDRECKTEIQTSYATQLETQCSPGYGTKCKPQQKTAYRKFCTTVQDTECRVTVQSSTKTSYEQKCSTSYEKVCSGHGYHQKCENVPKQDCQQVPKQVAVSNPVRQCSQVPKERCHQVSDNNFRRRCLSMSLFQGSHPSVGSEMFPHPPAGMLQCPCPGSCGCAC